MGKMYNMGESKGVINLGDVFYNELSDTGNMQTVARALFFAVSRM